MHPILYWHLPIMPPSIYPLSMVTFLQQLPFDWDNFSSTPPPSSMSNWGSNRTLLIPSDHSPFQCLRASGSHQNTTYRVSLTLPSSPSSTACLVVSAAFRWLIGSPAFAPLLNL